MNANQTNKVSIKSYLLNVYYSLSYSDHFFIVDSSYNIKWSKTCHYIAKPLLAHSFIHSLTHSFPYSACPNSAAIIVLRFESHYVVGSNLSHICVCGMFLKPNHSLSRSLIHLVNNSFIRLFVRLLFRAFVHSCIHLFKQTNKHTHTGTWARSRSYTHTRRSSLERN